MKLKNEILSIMSDWAPEDTAESWDNVGLQLDTNREISRVAVVLELNLDTWDIIKQYDYDLIISHHPLIFKPLHSVGYDDWGQNINPSVPAQVVLVIVVLGSYSITVICRNDAPDIGVEVNSWVDGSTVINA